MKSLVSKHERAEASSATPACTNAPPERVAADRFMRHKGYPDLEPTDIEHPSQFVWMFVYELPEGELDLRVDWLAESRIWNVAVEDFHLN